MKSLLCLVALALTACQGLSLESKAEATYGTFVAAEQAGASLVQSSEVSDSVKAQIKSADAAAKPVADALLSAIVAYRADPKSADALQGALTVALPAITILATETAK